LKGTAVERKRNYKASKLETHIEGIVSKHLNPDYGPCCKDDT
jgi:hypothetical protein